MVEYESKLEQIPPSGRLAIGVDAIEWTFKALNPPIETKQVYDYIARFLRIAREAISAAALSVSLPSDMLDEYDEVDESAEEPGTSHLLSAVMSCCDPDGEAISPSSLYEILSYCYEGTLDRSGIPVWTLEAERGNPDCLNVIRHQKELIDSYPTPYGRH